MDTLKTILTAITNMPHTPIITMVQLSVGGMIFTFQTMQAVIGILTLVVTRTPVPTATIIYGLETIISAQMNWRFTMKRFQTFKQAGQ